MKRAVAAVVVFLLALASPDPVAAAADFALVDMHGRPHSLLAYRGKWVVVNMWATWCEPCQKEMSELQAFARARPDVVVLGVAADREPPRRLIAFARRLRVTYPIIPANEQIIRDFAVHVIPTTLVFDPAGQRVLTNEGTISRDQLEEVTR